MGIGLTPVAMPTSQRILRAIVDERRRALSRSLHATVQHRRPPLENRLAELRTQATAFHQQAIVLNAKLAAMHGAEFETMREQLAESSARIDLGVADILDGNAPK